MKKEAFMLVSLKEQKAKKIAQVISSPTCRKILDYLANKEATETEIAKALNIPLSTVHYNLNHLKEAKLVEANEFHYSSKGKEVDHYKLANKYIIISPKEEYDFIEKLKTLIPTALILAVGFGFWQIVENKIKQATLTKAAPVLASVAEESVPVALNFAVETTKQTTWPYFAYGAVAALVLYLIIEWIVKKV